MRCHESRISSTWGLREITSMALEFQILIQNRHFCPFLHTGSPVCTNWKSCFCQKQEFQTGSRNRTCTEFSIVISNFETNFLFLHRNWQICLFLQTGIPVSTNRSSGFCRNWYLLLQKWAFWNWQFPSSPSRRKRWKTRTFVIRAQDHRERWRRADKIGGVGLCRNTRLAGAG